MVNDLLTHLAKTAHGNIGDILVVQVDHAYCHDDELLLELSFLAGLLQKNVEGEHDGPEERKDTLGLKKLVAEQQFVVDVLFHNFEHHLFVAIAD